MLEIFTLGIKAQDLYKIIKSNLQLILISGILGACLMACLIAIQPRQYFASTTYFLAKIPDVSRHFTYVSGVLVDDSSRLILNIKANGLLSPETLINCGLDNKKIENITFDDLYKISPIKPYDDRFTISVVGSSPKFVVSCLQDLSNKLINNQINSLDKSKKAINERIKQIQNTKTINTNSSKFIISLNGYNELEILESGSQNILFFIPQVVEPFFVKRLSRITPYNISLIIAGFWAGIILAIIYSAKKFLNLDKKV